MELEYCLIRLRKFTQFCLRLLGWQNTPNNLRHDCSGTTQDFPAPDNENLSEAEIAAIKELNAYAEMIIEQNRGRPKIYECPSCGTKSNSMWMAGVCGWCESRRYRKRLI